MEMNCEMICIAHIVNDDDGSLKIKEADREEFTDSKAYLDLSRL